MLFSSNYPALALQRAATALGSPHKVRRPYRSTERSFEMSAATGFEPSSRAACRFCPPLQWQMRLRTLWQLSHRHGGSGSGSAACARPGGFKPQRKFALTHDLSPTI
jgi:hypothetical protein